MVVCLCACVLIETVERETPGKVESMYFVCAGDPD